MNNHKFDVCVRHLLLKFSLRFNEFRHGLNPTLPAPHWMNQFVRREEEGEGEHALSQWQWSGFNTNCGGTIILYWKSKCVQHWQTAKYISISGHFAMWGPWMTLTYIFRWTVRIASACVAFWQTVGPPSLHWQRTFVLSRPGRASILSPENSSIR